jgi:hypothetical protein
MKTYKLPLLASAFDLQSRMTQMLGKVTWRKPGALADTEPPLDDNPAANCFLTRFTRDRGAAAYGGDGGDPRIAWDGAYAIHSTLFCIGEFLGWLEVIRRDVTFIQGSDAAVNLLLDGLRFQFSGEAPAQGAGASGEDFRRMQLYNAEMRAIGEVMAVSHENSAQRIMGYSQFIELLTLDTSPPAPPAAAGGFGAESSFAPASSVAEEQDGGIEAAAAYMMPAPRRGGGGGSPPSERVLAAQRLQRAFAKLHADLLAVAARPEARPRRRMAMLRVLLCRLIDELDPSGAQTEVQKAAAAAEEARWRQMHAMKHAAATGLDTVATTALQHTQSTMATTGVPMARASSRSLKSASRSLLTSFGRRTSVTGGAAEAAAAAADKAAADKASFFTADGPSSGLSESELSALLTPMVDLWQPPGIGADAGTPTSRLDEAMGRPMAGRLLLHEDTRVPLIPRSKGRWSEQYDADLPEKCAEYLHGLYGEMHALRLASLMEHARRMQWLQERETIEKYRDAMQAVARTGGGADAAAGADTSKMRAALRRVLPPALQEDGRAEREALRRVARLEATDRLAKAEQSVVQLEHMRVVMDIEKAPVMPPPHEQLRRCSTIIATATAAAAAAAATGVPAGSSSMHSMSMGRGDTMLTVAAEVPGYTPMMAPAEEER